VQAMESLSLLPSLYTETSLQNTQSIRLQLAVAFGSPSMCSLCIGSFNERCHTYAEPFNSGSSPVPYLAFRETGQAPET